MKSWMEMSTSKKQMLIVIKFKMIKNDTIFGTKKLDKNWEEYCLQQDSFTVHKNIINMLH